VPVPRRRVLARPETSSAGGIIGWPKVRGIPGLKIEILRLRSGQALGHPLFVLQTLPKMASGAKPISFILRIGGTTEVVP